MSNTTVVFDVKRRLITPPPVVGSEYTLQLTLLVWDKSESDLTYSSTTVGGAYAARHLHATRTWSVQTKSEPDDATVDEMEMFLASTRGGEQFTITDLDDGDAVISVQRVGGYSRNRESAADVGRFGYSFTVREVIA